MLWLAEGHRRATWRIVANEMCQRHNLAVGREHQLGVDVFDPFAVPAPKPTIGRDELVAIFGGKSKKVGRGT